MKGTENTEVLMGIITRLTRLVIVLLVALILVPILIINRTEIADRLSALFVEQEIKPYDESLHIKNQIKYWNAFGIERIQDSAFREKVEYGKELITHTSKYLGPNGSVAKISNGLNCQNCHLEAGTKVYGNNYGSVASLYPKFRPRSGGEVDIPARINGCFERSMNGTPLDRDSKEMEAMVTYMKYIGSNVPKGEKATGSGLKDLTFLDRAASPEKGKIVYQAKCASCHMEDGQGVLNMDSLEYMYPPLWGEHSFNDGAGLSRITKMAKYVKYNMPFGVSHDAPQLTDEEAWDVSAYINAQPRPHLETPNDWPDLTKKPIDHPFGPYSDHFTEEQHKFGPFKEILNKRKQ
tara:strand:+ start:45525 stop:46574 length:1050 start_codon:yes stop_codon:yes gene_type:complete